MQIYNIFLIIGISALLFGFFTKKRSAIWGGATFGFLIGVVLGIVKKDFSEIIRAVLIGADVGLFAELLGLLGDRIKSRKV